VIRPHALAEPVVVPRCRHPRYSLPELSRGGPECAYMDTLTGSTAVERAAVLLDHCYLDGPGSAIHNRILRLTRQVWGEDPLAHERLLRISPTCLRRVLRFWLRGLSPASFAWYRFPSGERECCYRHTRVPVPAFLVGALSLLGRGGYWRHSEPSAARTTRLFRIAGPYVSRYPAAKEALTWYRPLLKAFVLDENAILRAQHAVCCASTTRGAQAVRSGRLYAIWTLTHRQLDRATVYGASDVLRRFTYAFNSAAAPWTNSELLWTFTVGEVSMRRRNRQYCVKDNNRAFPLPIVPGHLLMAIPIGVRQRRLALQAGTVIGGCGAPRIRTRSVWQLEAAVITNQHPCDCTCRDVTTQRSVQGEPGTCPCRQYQERLGRRDAACAWGRATRIIFRYSKAQILRAFRAGQFVNEAGLAEWDGDTSQLHVSSFARSLSGFVALGGRPPLAGYKLMPFGLYQLVVLDIETARHLFEHGLARESERQLRVLEAYVTWSDGVCVGLFEPTNAPPVFFEDRHIAHLEGSPFSCSKVYRVDQILFLRRLF
jgi:hypothetical protein